MKTLLEEMTTYRDAVKEDVNQEKDPGINQYAQGTDLLWMAHYRSSPEIGDMNGNRQKFSGTLEEAAGEAQRFAEEQGLILQCLRRRY